MKKLFKPVSFFLVALTAASCSKDKSGVEIVEEGKRPLVDYEILKDPAGDPFTFQFKNKSTNFKLLEWRFDDDSLSTDDSPAHVYYKTGTFEVNLKAVSESGAVGRKLQVIKIIPDSVVKLSTTATGKENQVQYHIDTKAQIESVNWTFEDNTTSTDAAPLKDYKSGTLNAFALKVVTKKGSVIEVNKFGTTAGIVSNITNSVSMAVSSDNGGGKNANEGSLKLLDGKVDTKMYQNWPAAGFTATFTLPVEQTVKFYGIGSANDTETRDPKTWTLEGSKDGNTWEVIDSRNQSSNFYAQAGKWKQMFYFSVANPKPFSFYRWKVTANFGSGGFQISEFQLFK